MSKLKPAVLCVESDSFIANSSTDPKKPGIYELGINEVPANTFHFINRRVCDTLEESGLFHTIAHKFPQLLVYVTLRNQHGEYLSYSRGNQGGESRLADLRSIGIGGHTDIADVQLDKDGNISAAATLALSAIRELEEEVGISVDITIPATCKVIANFDDPASSVHIGVWIDLIVDPETITETIESLDQKWLSKDMLFQDLASYEPWSQQIIMYIQ